MDLEKLILSDLENPDLVHTESLSLEREMVEIMQSGEYEASLWSRSILRRVIGKEEEEEEELLWLSV